MHSKTKNSIAVVGFFIVLWLCYTLAFAKTWRYKKDHDHLKKEVQLYKDMPEQLAMLTQKVQYYDSLQKTLEIAETSFQHSVLKTINNTAAAYNFKLVDFREPHFFEKDSLRKSAYRFTVEGNFMSLLTCIHHLEQKTKFGEVIHCNLEKKKDRKRGTERLEGQLILQHTH